MSSPLVRAVFAALALATIGAFVLAQQLKGELPLVLTFAVSPHAISPNGDGTRDSARVGFNLTRPAEISFSILDADGNEVRRLVDNKDLAGDVRYRYHWDGRDDSGTRVPDGTYRLRVFRRDEGRSIVSIKKLQVDTKPPRVRLASVRPGVIAPGEPGRPAHVVIRYRGPRNDSPEIRVFRTDDGPPRVVYRFRGTDTKSAVWNGLVRGHPAADGAYAFTVRVRDSAGNVTVAPRDIPTRATAAPATGASVRRLSLRGPVGVVAAGSIAHLELGPVQRSFDFALSRIGSPGLVKKGERIGGSFRVRVPGRARTGIYLVRVRAAGRRAVWPLAVAGLPPKGAPAARPLVVLPAITAEGLNPIDDDLNGFVDTLENSRRIALDRPLVGGARLPGYSAEVLPLLRFLDRAKLGYDLTTDLALARKQGPALGNAPGVAFAGSARWLTPGLLQRLRAYVEGGGRLASFGAEAFRRDVQLGANGLGDPTPRKEEDVFGERTSLLKTSTAPLVVDKDGLNLFRGIDNFFGDFSRFEVSAGLPEGARELSGAGRDPGKPAFVAYRLAKGLVIRSGTAQWARDLPEARLSLEVPRVTTRIWRILSGR